MIFKPKIDINPQFEKAIDLIENSSKHIFITGKAGTGKSTLLNYFRKITKRNHVVLAPTGIAAVNVEGETIHSFFGFHPGINPFEAKKEAQNKRNVDLYRNLDLIIIDEVSMVRADLLDSVDVFLRTINNNTCPFGGVQIIFIGDLFQLPPVVTNDEKLIFEEAYESPYFFDSIAIKDVFNSVFDDFELIELKKIYRQEDQTFIDLLNKIRNKTFDFQTIKELNSRYIADAKLSDEYVYLVATNKQAEEINKYRLSKLNTEEYEFLGDIFGDFDEKALPSDFELVLKKGARVMFTKNDPEGRWINGSIGTVTKIENDIDAAVIVVLDNGNKVEVGPATWGNYKSTFNYEKQAIEREEIGSYTQLPLKLAWAFTIHKSQGRTFEKVVIDLGWGAFAHGQTYVALSRCKSFEGIILKKPLKSKDIIMDPRVHAFMDTFTPLE